MTESERKIHNAAIKDALRQIQLMPGWTLSRKLTIKAVRSCLLKKHKAEVIPLKEAKMSEAK